MNNEATALITKGAAFAASNSLFANLVIFQDSSYWMLAIAGAVVSAFGVLHDIVEHDGTYTKLKAFAAMVNGIFVGLIAIPFFYLTLSNLGDAVLGKFLSVDTIQLSNSLWLIVSFGMSWYAVPIWNAVVSKVSRKGKKKLEEL